MSIIVGRHEIDVETATAVIKAYCTEHRATVLYYDLAGEPNGTVVPSDGINLADVGRMSLVNPDLTGDDVATLFEHVAPRVDWTLVPGCARLEDADRDEPDGLYWDMSTLWDQVCERGIGFAKTSKLLHMKRPFAFPILDSYVQNAYATRSAQAARDAGMSGPRGGERRLYWAVIRDDLIAAEEAFREVRTRLDQAEDDLVKRAVRLPDLRFLDILAWRLESTAVR